MVFYSIQNAESPWTFFWTIIPFLPFVLADTYLPATLPEGLTFQRRNFGKTHLQMSTGGQDATDWSKGERRGRKKKREKLVSWGGKDFHKQQQSHTCGSSHIKMRGEGFKHQLHKKKKPHCRSPLNNVRVWARHTHTPHPNPSCIPVWVCINSTDVGGISCFVLGFFKPSV